MSKFFTIFLIFCSCFLFTACDSNKLIPEQEVEMLNTETMLTTENVETMQQIEPATGTNFTRKNQYIDNSLDKVDDYANQLNQQMNELDQLK